VSRTILWLCLMATACAPLDPTDCRTFSDCTRFVPNGQLCGLAHQGDNSDEHTGSSCRTESSPWTDPARHAPATGTISARAAGEACPATTDAVTLGDHEATGLAFSTCALQGNANVVPRRAEDVPDGVVCGIGRALGTGQACEGVAPHIDLACPPGFSLRWVPDYFLDAVDQTCTSTTDGTWRRNAWIDLVLFCARDAHATPTAPPPLTPGALCGLHARNHPVDVFGSTLPDTPTDSLDLLDTLFGWCSDHPLIEHADLLTDIASTPATCLGQPVADGCPEGLTMQCTWDQFSVSPELGPNILEESWCWCAVPEGSQGSFAPEERTP